MYPWPISLLTRQCTILSKRYYKGFYKNTIPILTSPLQCQDIYTPLYFFNISRSLWLICKVVFVLHLLVNFFQGNELFKFVFEKHDQITEKALQFQFNSPKMRSPGAFRIVRKNCTTNLSKCKDKNVPW